MRFLGHGDRGAEIALLTEKGFALRDIARAYPSARGRVADASLPGIEANTILAAVTRHSLPTGILRHRQFGGSGCIDFKMRD